MYMGSFLGKMERKYGKYAIQNLTLVLIACYVIGYLIELLFPAAQEYLVLNPYLILHGQIWRLFSWVFIPPESLDLFTVLMLFFYFSIGTSLERTWGSFRYNIYLLSGMLFTVLGSFVLYGIGWHQFAEMIQEAKIDAATVFSNAGYIRMGSEMIILPGTWFYRFSTFYINMSIILAYAATYPEERILLMFLFPLKIKYFGILEAVFLLYAFVMGDMATRVVIVASLMNFLIFFLMTRNYRRVSPAEFQRKAAYRNKVRRAGQMGHASQYQGKTVVTRHRCAVCGRSELDDPDLEFRFCSKCDGNYEYCSDHLYTHEHVKRIVPEEK